jgi:hypothetical protein
MYAPDSAAARSVPGSRCPAHTSLTISAPAASAEEATLPFVVSMLTAIASPNSATSAATVGTASAASAAGET